MISVDPEFSIELRLKCYDLVEDEEMPEFTVIFHDGEWRVQKFQDGDSARVYSSTEIAAISAAADAAAKIAEWLNTTHKLPSEVSAERRMPDLMAKAVCSAPRTISAPPICPTNMKRGSGEGPPKKGVLYCDACASMQYPLVNCPACKLIQIADVE